MSISLSIIHLRSNEETARASDQVFLNIQPTFQREYEAWDNKLKTRLVETMLIGRSMNPIWTVHNDEEDSDEVLDGMHRLTTALNFINNKFPIGKDLMELDSSEFAGKYFKDLSTDQKQKIRHYSFIINNLDSSYKKDHQKLHDMYELLNRSSKPLNDFEFQKPLLQPFYELLQSYTEKFIDSPLFRKKDSKRGQLEEELGKCLSFCEYSLPKFSSINDMYKKWKIKMFGQSGKITAQGVDIGMNDYADKFSFCLSRIKYVMDTFDQLDLFCDKKRSTIEYMMIITRTVALIHSNDVFVRLSTSLAEKFSDILYQNDEKDEDEKYRYANRNGDFQTKLVAQIDLIICSVMDDSKGPRLFSREMIDEKLKNDQQGKCAICQKPITSKHRYEGDHILSWTNGGKTEIENLQVVHHRCHKLK